jgi:hypothetical protein
VSWFTADKDGNATEFACNAVAYLNLKLGAHLKYEDREYQEAISKLEQRVAELMLYCAIQGRRKAEQSPTSKPDAKHLDDEVAECGE